MSLWALGSLLTRRFSPRAQAQAPATGTQAARGSAAGRPARFLHSLRTLAVGGAVAAAAGGFAFMYLKKDTDESAGKVIEEKAMKEVTDKKPGNAGKVISDEACDDRKAGHEVTGSEPLKEQRDMKAEFEDWMKKYDKTYRDEEEKAMRFQLFKASVEFRLTLLPVCTKEILSKNKLFCRLDTSRAAEATWNISAGRGVPRVPTSWKGVIQAGLREAGNPQPHTGNSSMECD